MVCLSSLCGITDCEGARLFLWTFLLLFVRPLLRGIPASEVTGNPYGHSNGYSYGDSYGYSCAYSYVDSASEVTSYSNRLQSLSLLRYFTNRLTKAYADS